MIGGIRNIRFAATANLSAESTATAHYYAKPVVVTNEYADICDTGNGAIQLDRSVHNGSALYDATITFLTLSEPSSFVNARSFIYTDTLGRNWLLGWGDEDDYPVVTWKESNQKNASVMYEVTASMKSRVGVMRVL